MEGCAPLTEADKNSIAGCATRYAVADKPSSGQWVPRDTFNVDRNEQYQESNSIEYIKYSSKVVKYENLRIHISLRVLQLRNCPSTRCQLKCGPLDQIDVAVVYVKFDINHEGRSTFVNDVAQIRLLGHNKSPSKMYTVKFYRSTGKMSIAVSARTRSFFFTNERDQDKVSKERTDIINQMQLTHVGFWIREAMQFTSMNSASAK